MSPYNFTANNPVLYVDQDGRDYAVFINHKTKAIVIKATYHVVESSCDAEMAAAGVGKWMEQNGKFKYVVSTRNGGTIEYDIVFELRVKEHHSERARNDAYANDKSGERNLLYTSIPRLLDWGEAMVGPDGGISKIRIENSTEALDRGTPAHEIGHTLVGFGHWRSGLMKGSGRDPMKPEDQDVTIGNVTKILQHAGFGSSADVPAIDSYHPPLQNTARPKGTLLPSSGTEPSDFKRGTVQHIQPRE